MEKRQCTACNLAKEIKDFYSKSADRGGFMTACKACLIEKSKAHYSKNKEKIKPRILAYKKADPERLASWRKNEYKKDYTKRAKLVRQKRVKEAAGVHTKEDIRQIFNEQCGLCVYCRDSLDNKFHKDHVMPLKLGGSHCKENIQLLCPSCSFKKNDLHPAIYEKRINFGGSRGIF